MYTRSGQSLPQYTVQHGTNFLSKSPTCDCYGKRLSLIALQGDRALPSELAPVLQASHPPETPEVCQAMPCKSRDSRDMSAYISTVPVQQHEP